MEFLGDGKPRAEDSPDLHHGVGQRDNGTRQRRTWTPPWMRQFVRIIGDQAEHMNALVSDLLDVARIETGTLPVFPEPAEVAVLEDQG